MLNKIRKILKKNTEITALALLVLITISSTTYYNSNKQQVISNYEEIINNVFLKKTINHIFNNLEPKFKKITHKVAPGETLNNILEKYYIEKSFYLKIFLYLNQLYQICLLNS